MKKTVLIVDDDKSILRTFSHILQKQNYTVETAENGRQALEKAKNYHYDLLLLDIRLPDMEGTDLLDKAKEEFQKTVKIVITGFPSIETGVKALSGDAVAYLSKPVKPRELLEIIDEQFYDATVRANLNNQCLA